MNAGAGGPVRRVTDSRNRFGLGRTLGSPNLLFTDEESEAQKDEVPAQSPEAT